MTRLLEHIVLILFQHNLESMKISSMESWTTISIHFILIFILCSCQLQLIYAMYLAMNRSSSLQGTLADHSGVHWSLVYIMDVRNNLKTRVLWFTITGREHILFSAQSPTDAYFHCCVLLHVYLSLNSSFTLITGCIVLYLGRLQILFGWTKIFCHLLLVRSNCIHMRPWISGNRSRPRGRFILFQCISSSFLCLETWSVLTDLGLTYQNVDQVFCFISFSIPNYISTSSG